MLKAMCEFSDSGAHSAEVWLCDENRNRVVKVLWPVLQSRSKLWRRMLKHEWRETRPDGDGICLKCNRDTVLAFRDFLYVGRPRNTYVQANARTLYHFGVYYEIVGLCEWLLQYAIQSPLEIIAAMRSACCSEDEPKSEFDIMEACISRLKKSNDIASCPQFCFAGMDYKMIETIVLAYMWSWRTCAVTAYLPETPRNRIIRQDRTVKAFLLLDKWYSANLRHVHNAHAQACRIFDEMDLSMFPSDFVLSTIRASGLLPSRVPAQFTVQVHLTPERRDLQITGMGPFDMGMQLRQRIRNSHVHIPEKFSMFILGNTIGDMDPLFGFTVWDPDFSVYVSYDP